MNESKAVTLRGVRVTREDVIAAIKACQHEGQAAFLANRGYAPATRYFLRYGGKLYPSKAILGGAAGLSPSQFFGGISETVALLKRLGFQVRDIKRGGVVDLVRLRQQIQAAGFDDPEKPWPELPREPSACFLSGSNRAPEIRAIAAAGGDVGVCASDLRSSGESALYELAGQDVTVFCDSGAFSEVALVKDRPLGEARLEVVKPMEHEDWLDVLALYKRLASRLGSQLAVVAPDRVGCQKTTLARLERYRVQLQEIHSFGAQIMVPIQKGQLEPWTFAGYVNQALLSLPFIPAIPCKKGATTPAVLRSFCRLFLAQRIHLLGLGVRNRKAAEYLEAIPEECGVSMDSCWIAANVGRGKKPRRLTKARDLAEDVLRARGVFSHALQVSAAIFTCLTGGAV